MMRKKKMFSTRIRQDLIEEMETEAENPDITKAEIIEECLSARYKIYPKTVREVFDMTKNVKLTAEYLNVSVGTVYRRLKNEGKDKNL